MKPRNIVFLHLESVCTLLLQQHEEHFPALRELMARSSVLDRFFTTCPSSITAFCDCLFGNLVELDHVIDFDARGNQPRGRDSNLIDILGNRGYRTHGVGYPTIWRDDINDWKLFGKGAPFAWYDEGSGDDFHGRVRDIIEQSSEEPFALYVWNQLSHLSYSDSERGKSADEDGFSRLHRGYRALDETIGFVWQTLVEAGKQNDTVIIAFGDHGDEFWTHGLYFGFCHAFEPYTGIIKTPALVYRPGSEPGHLSHVTSLVDLKATALDVLGIPSEDSLAWDSGTSVFECRQKPAPCRTLFANQKPNKALPKCFSVTDEEFHLIAGPFGLELYAYRMDPSNHNNLLSFFELREDGTLRFDDRGATHSHFKKTFNPALVGLIEARFLTLRRELARLIRGKYRDLAEARQHLFNPESLFAARPREFTWNRSHLDIDDSSPACRTELELFLAGKGRYADLFLEAS